MILHMKPLNLAEVKETIVSLNEKKELREFLKKFEKFTLPKKSANELANELKKINNPKLKEEYIIKITDFLPKTAQDLNKVFINISLDEKETNEILEIVRKY